jgi:hypothetical protein
MHTHFRHLLLFLLALCLLFGALWVVTRVVAADPPEVRWWVFGSAGGSANSDAISINYTMGQPIVGTNLGGNIVLSAGYWVAVTPTLKPILYLPIVMK